MSYFPMFIDLTNCDCLIVGGGMVAYRKAMTLLDFDAKVFVVAPDICDSLMELSKSSNRLFVWERDFLDEDLSGKTLVVVATNNATFNREISKKCKALSVPVNVVDVKDECSFIFPSYVKEQNLIAAFSSSGNSPVLTQYLKKKEKDVLTPFLGDLNECLGKWRKNVLEIFPTEKERKEVFLRIVEEGLSGNIVPSDEKIREIISDIQRKDEAR